MTASQTSLLHFNTSIADMSSGEPPPCKRIKMIESPSSSSLPTLSAAAGARAVGWKIGSIVSTSNVTNFNPKSTITTTAVKQESSTLSVASAFAANKISKPQGHELVTTECRILEYPASRVEESQSLATTTTTTTLATAEVVVATVSTDSSSLAVIPTPPTHPVMASSAMESLPSTTVSVELNQSASVSQTPPSQPSNLSISGHSAAKIETENLAGGSNFDSSGLASPKCEMHIPSGPASTKAEAHIPSEPAVVEEKSSTEPATNNLKTTVDPHDISAPVGAAPSVAAVVAKSATIHKKQEPPVPTATSTTESQEKQPLNAQGAGPVSSVSSKVVLPTSDPSPPSMEASIGGRHPAVTYRLLRQKYIAELDYMLREFQKLEKQLLGAKSHAAAESTGSRERREKLHSFILHLQDTVQRIQNGCEIEEACDSAAAGSGTATDASLQQQDDEDTIQKLEEHILTSLLPVKVRLKKQLAAQQGAAQNPATMPVRGVVRTDSAGTTGTAVSAKTGGTMSSVPPQAKPASQAATNAPAVQQHPPVEDRANVGFGKPLGRRGSCLTQKLHGSTLGSASRLQGHGVGSNASDDAATSDDKPKVLYGGMALGSDQQESSVAAASSVHRFIIKDPPMLEKHCADVMDDTNDEMDDDGRLADPTPVTPHTPFVQQDHLSQRSQERPVLEPAPLDSSMHVPKPASQDPQPASSTGDTIAAPTASGVVSAQAPTTAATALTMTTTSNRLNMSSEERRRKRKRRRKKKLRREQNAVQLAQAQQQQQQQLQQQQQQQILQQPPIKRKKTTVGKKRGPRSVEYMCANCNEVYNSTCDDNPWWALTRHECPKCQKTQIPRIDIGAPANAIEYHPALLAHAEENGGAVLHAAAESVHIPPSHLEAAIPTGPKDGQDLDSLESDLSDDDGLLSDADSENSFDSDTDDLASLSPAEQAEREKFGFEYVGPKFRDDEASRLLILMMHASICPCQHQSEEHRNTCLSVKWMMLHVRDCPGTTSAADVCPFPWCRKVKHLLYHLVSCEKPKECVICNPPKLSRNLRRLQNLNEYRFKRKREDIGTFCPSGHAECPAIPHSLATSPRDSKNAGASEKHSKVKQEEMNHPVASPSVATTRKTKQSLVPKMTKVSGQISANVTKGKASAARRATAASTILQVSATSMAVPPAIIRTVGTPPTGGASILTTPIVVMQPAVDEKVMPAPVAIGRLDRSTAASDVKQMQSEPCQAPDDAAAAKVSIPNESVSSLLQQQPVTDPLLGPKTIKSETVVALPVSVTALTREPIDALELTTKAFDLPVESPSLSNSTGVRMELKEVVNTNTIEIKPLLEVSKHPETKAAVESNSRSPGESDQPDSYPADFKVESHLPAPSATIFLMDEMGNGEERTLSVPLTLVSVTCPDERLGKGKDHEVGNLATSVPLTLNGVPVTESTVATPLPSTTGAQTLLRTASHNDGRPATTALAVMATTTTESMTEDSSSSTSVPPKSAVGRDSSSAEPLRVQ